MTVQQRRARPRAVSTPRRSKSRSRRVGNIHQRFSELFENASDIIVINDRDGGIVDANRAAREFAGYTLADLERGMHLRDVLPSADYEAAMILTERALDDLPFPEVYERETVLRDGGTRVLELRSNVLRRPNQPPLLQTIGRDITEKKEAAAFQSSLLQVSQALLTAQSLDHLGRVVCEEASRVLRVDGAYLWLRHGDELIGCASASVAAQEFIGVRRSLDDSLVGQIYRASDVLVINDFQHSLYSADRATDVGVQAMLAMPLRRQAPPVGVLLFTDNTNPRRFTAAVRERALIFGAQITVAIESALAREREEEEGRVSAALLHVTRALRESLEEVEVLPRIVRGAREAVPCDWAIVALRDANKGAFRITTVEGLPPEATDELKLLDLRPGTLGLIDGIMASETREIVEPRGRLELYERWGIASLLAVPMLRAGRVIGALVVGYRERRGTFSSRERRIVEGIAAQAAAAVNNARLVEDLRAANQLKSEFLGTMSHELRTPLNAILGYADLMRERVMGPISSEQGEVLDRILLNGRGLLELINMTLDVNRLEAGRIAVRASEFTLDDLLAELRTELSVAVNPNVTLSWPEHVALPALYTDHGKLRAVVRNLIDNALKFTRRGSVAVSAGRGGDPDRIWIAVADTGIGIPSTAATSIFEMFRQLDDTVPNVRGGVGLGLYVVRRYTDLLGGKVTLESAPGAGSTFTIDIPLRLKAESQAAG